MGLEILHSIKFLDSVDAESAGLGPPFGKSHLAFSWGQQMFSVMGQVINSSGVVGHMVSVSTTQLCHSSLKAPIDHI